MLKDIKSQTNALLSLSPAARTSSADGSTVDLRDYGSAAFVVLFGTHTDGTHTPSAEESDDGSNWDAIAAGDLAGSFAAVSSSAGNGTVQRVGYLGSKRYVRVVMTCAGTTTGALSSAIVVAGHAAQQPVA
ncbi:MAG: hypothetical protein AB7G06_09980 [Bdellovibrionales bacterium]